METGAGQGWDSGRGWVSHADAHPDAEFNAVTWVGAAGGVLGLPGVESPSYSWVWSEHGHGGYPRAEMGSNGVFLRLVRASQGLQC